MPLVHCDGPVVENYEKECAIMVALDAVVLVVFILDIAAC